MKKKKKKKEGYIETTPLLHFHPNQSMQSNKDNELDPKRTLTHSKTCA